MAHFYRCFHSHSLHHSHSCPPGAHLHLRWQSCRFLLFRRHSPLFRLISNLVQFQSPSGVGETSEATRSLLYQEHCPISYCPHSLDHCRYFRKRQDHLDCHHLNHRHLRSCNPPLAYHPHPRCSRCCERWECDWTWMFCHGENMIELAVVDV